MGYINPNAPDPDLDRRGKIERDKVKADDLARQVLFSGQSTYNGTARALARLAARAGKPRLRKTKEESRADDPKQK